MNQYEILANEYKLQLESSNEEIRVLKNKIESTEKENKQKLYEKMNEINEVRPCSTCLT